MANVIVAFSKQEDARNIKNILTKNGFSVVHVCTSGAQAITAAEGLSAGIIVCGYRLPDMLSAELYDCLPPDFAMLMVSSPARRPAQLPEKVVCLPVPLKVHALVETMAMMEEAQARCRRRQRMQPRQRNEEEKNIINQAKRLLMERNGMTEEEAHRYIQKCSMDSGTNMIETAQMVISLIRS